MQSILSNKYGQDFIFPVDIGAWHKINEDFTGARFNRNSYYEDSRGDKQAKLTEHYFHHLVAGAGIPIADKPEPCSVWDRLVMGRRIDVKSKRRNTRPPKQHYGYHIDKTQLKHDCDHYVFCDVFYANQQADDPIFGAFAGWLPKNEFMSLSVFVTAGEEQPDGWKARMTGRWICGSMLRCMPSFLHAAIKNPAEAGLQRDGIWGDPIDRWGQAKYR
jgi:hypothetical protein